MTDTTHQPTSLANDPLEVAQEALARAIEALVTAQEATAGSEWANVNAQSALDLAEIAQEEARAAQTAADNALVLARPYSTPGNAGAATALEIDLDTPAALRAAPGGTLSVTVRRLGRDVEKLTTLILQPASACAIAWSASDGEAIWATAPEVASLAGGQTAVINIWQIGGLVLLSTVHQTA